MPAFAALHDALGWYRQGQRLLGEAVEALAVPGRAVETGGAAAGPLARAPRRARPCATGSDA